MNYYLFALFIFVLVCGGLVVGKVLFGSLKGQKQLLDEKEVKLLRLYDSLEEGMEDFYATARETKQEMEENLQSTISQLEEFKSIVAAQREHMELLAETPVAEAEAVEPEEPEQVAQTPPEAPPAAPQPIDEVPRVQPIQPIQQPVQEPVAQAVPAQEPRRPVPQAQAEYVRGQAPTKQEQIQILAQQGWGREQIAETLEITLGEVDLIMGLMNAGLN